MYIKKYLLSKKQIKNNMFIDYSLLIFFAYNAILKVEIQRIYYTQELYII
jgi:hypothetical protein